MSLSFAHCESHDLLTQFAQPHNTIAAPLAVVGAITAHVFPLIEYRYIVTALFPIRYKKSSFPSILYTLVASGVTVHAGTVSVVPVLLDIVRTCPIPVPAVIRT